MKYSACKILTSLVISGLIIGFGIAYLVEAADMINGPSNFWIWCILMIIIQVLAAIYFIAKVMAADICGVGGDEESSGGFGYDKEKHFHENAHEMVKNRNAFDGALALAILGMTIWGCVIWSQLDAGDHAGYPEHLWIWFSVIFITYLSLFSCVGCCVCLAICSGVIRAAAN
jgi:hypothetical protein